MGEHFFNMLPFVFQSEKRKNRGLFRTVSNILDEIFDENS